MTSVTIADSVTSIGREAFYGCTSLTSITLPSTTTITIWRRALKNCYNLESIIIPSNVTTITTYGNAFLNDEELAIYYLGSSDDITITNPGETRINEIIHYISETVDAENATCTKDGNITYYACADEECDKVIYVDDEGNYVVGTIDDATLTATGHSYYYSSCEDGTHFVYCSNDDCEYAVEENCTYNSGVLSTDGTYYTYTCIYCGYYYTEDVVAEEEDEEEGDSEDEDDSETTTTTSCTHTSTTSTVNYTTGTKTTTCDTCGEILNVEYNCSEYLVYIGGILMSRNETTTAEDVSTGSGMTATETAGTSAVAVVSLMGVAYAVMIGRKRK